MHFELMSIQVTQMRCEAGTPANKKNVGGVILLLNSDIKSKEGTIIDITAYVF